MVGNVAPPPKRRKTANESAPMTANAIAQANSTAQFFTGHHQNRWMFGNASQQQGQNGTGQAGHQPRSSEPRTDHEGNISDGTANTVDQGDADTNQTAERHGGKQNYMSPYPVTQRPAGGSTQNRVAPVVPSATSRLGPISRPPESNSLPSPASGEGNMQSPALLTEARLPASGTGPQQYAPPGTHPGRPARSFSMSQAQANVPPQAPPMAPPTTFRSNQPARNSPPSSAILRSNQPVQNPPPVSNGGFRGQMFNPQSMLDRLDVFIRGVPREQQIDHGRLSLLREAVQRQDWFYITLSQLHALSSHPFSLPTVARHPAGFACLDTILAANAHVSPLVLQTLAAFPAHLKDIYSSLDKDIYNDHVMRVAQFLHSLPMHWSELVRACKERLAPPLVEDMWDCFGLPSRVLQTTIFRAIGRMIPENGNANAEHTQGNADGLEPLHYLNQDSFYRGYRRSGQSRTMAYAALRDALHTWRRYRADIKVFKARQTRLRPEERARPPDFVMPAHVMQAFQVISVSTTAVNGGATAAVARGNRPLNMNPQNVTPAFPPLLVSAQLQPPGPHLLFPHETAQVRPLPTHPDPIRSALHQAHLRSPTLTPVATTEEKPRLYRYVMSSFAMSPSRIDERLPINVIEFNIDADAFSKIPIPRLPESIEAESTVPIETTTLMYRLRCVAIPPQGIPDEKTWIQADTAWPEGLFLDLNSQMLETRKRLHNGRNLPIDLTAHIQQGRNILRLLINRVSTDTRLFAFAIAVEVVGVKTHDDITSGLTQITLQASLAAIKQSLCTGGGSNEDDDDGFAITSSNLNISLVEPYSGDRMVQTPVRGSGCLHRDCFDLEIFLSMCKRTHPDGPTVVDCWRCPICRGDVRPQTLVTDEFLVKVLADLQSQGMSETRAIVVDQDGSWKAKEEEQTGVRSPSLEREERADSKGNASAKKAVEVIELD